MPPHLLASVLLAACLPPSGNSADRRLAQPIAFVSRNRLGDIPPWEAAGRDERPGGTLYRRDADGLIRELVWGPELYDVASPSVSPDGEHIVFSAIEGPQDRWAIWRVAADGGLAIPISDPFKHPFHGQLQDRGAQYWPLQGLGDHAPFYLPDGRVAFASTRYPSLMPSSGLRASNLYVMKEDGSDLRRITSARAGVIDGSVLADGRILASFASDNQNAPHPEQAGLRALEQARDRQQRYWWLWVLDPDGTHAVPYAKPAGGSQNSESWGLHQPRELPDGRLLASLRRDTSLTDAPAWRSGVAIFEAGLLPEQELFGFGLPLGLGEGYALGAAPLDSGQLLLSHALPRFAPSGAELRPDFDLYLLDESLEPDSLKELVAFPLTDELDAVPIVSWEAEQLLDWTTASPPDSPLSERTGTLTLTCSGVYDDLPLVEGAPLSPKPGSVARVLVYADSQQLDCDDNPLLYKQAPSLVAEADVGSLGHFELQVPADRPLFFMLVNERGVVARHQPSPAQQGAAEPNAAAFLAQHLAWRPDSAVTCSGCHQGHMRDADHAEEAGRINLARLAQVESDDVLGPEERFPHGAWRVADQRLPDEENRYGWVAPETKEGQAQISLVWPAELVVEDLTLHVLPGGGHVDQIVTVFGAGVVSVSSPFGEDGEPCQMALGGESSDELTIYVMGEHPLGLGEVEVFGDAPSWPEAELPAPSGLAMSLDMRLSWDWQDEPMLGGYQLLASAPELGSRTWRDIGLVAEHALLLEDYAPGQRLCAQLQAYDLSGHASAEGASAPACGVVPELRLDEVQPSSGQLGTALEVTLRGAGFAEDAGLVASICGYALRDLEIVADDELRGVTRADRPLEAGSCDVEVSLANGLSDGLEEAFSFQ